MYIDRPVNFVLFSQHYTVEPDIRILHLHAQTQLQEIKEHQEQTLNPLKELKSANIYSRCKLVYFCFL